MAHDLPVGTGDRRETAMSAPFFVDNDILRGPRGADCAYLFQNVLASQSGHMKRFPHHGSTTRPEPLTKTAALCQLLLAGDHAPELVEKTSNTLGTTPE